MSEIVVVPVDRETILRGLRMQTPCDELGVFIQVPRQAVDEAIACIEAAIARDLAASIAAAPSPAVWTAEQIATVEREAAILATKMREPKFATDDATPSPSALRADSLRLEAPTGLPARAWTECEKDGVRRAAETINAREDALRVAQEAVAATLTDRIVDEVGDFGTYQVYFASVDDDDDAMVVLASDYDRLLKAYEALRALAPTALSPDPWDSKQLGASEAHVQVAPESAARGVDEAMNEVHRGQRHDRQGEPTVTPPQPRKVGEVALREVLAWVALSDAAQFALNGMRCTPESIHAYDVAADEAVHWVRGHAAPLLAELEALRVDSLRYKWLANRVLACDYGDNDKGEAVVGWRIRFDLLAHDGERQPDFMHGPSIDAAIDAALALRDKESGE